MPISRFLKWNSNWEGKISNLIKSLDFSLYTLHKMEITTPLFGSWKSSSKRLPRGQFIDFILTVRSTVNLCLQCIILVSPAPNYSSLPPGEEGGGGRL